MDNETSGNVRDLGAPVLLVNVRNEHEANIVESILNAEQIPSLRKHKYAGSYLNIQMGMSDYGMDIYVPESLLAMAKDLLIGIQGEMSAIDKNEDINEQVNEEIDDEIDEDVVEADYVLDYQEKRRTRALFFMALVWGLPTVIWLISELMKLVE